MDEKDEYSFKTIKCFHQYAHLERGLDEMKRRKIFLVPVGFLMILFLLSFSFGEEILLKEEEREGFRF